MKRSNASKQAQGLACGGKEGVPWNCVSARTTSVHFGGTLRRMRPAWLFLAALLIAVVQRAYGAGVLGDEDDPVACSMATCSYKCICQKQLWVFYYYHPK